MQGDRISNAATGPYHASDNARGKNRGRLLKEKFVSYTNEILRRERGDFDFRPSIRRGVGLVASPFSACLDETGTGSPVKAIGSRVSAGIAFFGDLGSSSSKSKQTATNQQVTSQGSAGSGGTATVGAGAYGNTLNLVTTTQDVSAPVVAAAVGGNVAATGAAIAGNTLVSGAAIQGNTAAAQLAISAGVADTSAALNANSGVVGLALTENDHLANMAIHSANDSANIVANFAAAGLYQANQLANANTGTIHDLANDLGTIALNAAPQTEAAQNEIAAGSSPSGNAISSNTVLIAATIIGTILTAVVFFNSRGRAT